MRVLLRFWQKDRINKLIVLVSGLILMVMALQAYLLLATPAGPALAGRIFPTATLSVAELFQAGLATGTARAEQAAAVISPTITTMAFTAMPGPTHTRPPATATLAPSASPTISVSATPTATATPAATASQTPALGQPPLACLPDTPAQAGFVLEVQAGNTARVMIDGLVYTVRYLGVEAPEAPHHAQTSAYYNGQWVFARDVLLYADGPDTDEHNRLLRYLVVGEKLVNAELIEQGLARAAPSPPDYRCAARFSAAEQAARARGAGLWQPPTP